MRTFYIIGGIFLLFAIVKLAGGTMSKAAGEKVGQWIGTIFILAVLYAAYTVWRFSEGVP